MMTIRTIITVAQHERAILIKDGRAVSALMPGRHVIWSLNTIEVVRYDTRAIVVDMPDEHAALMPDGALRTVVVSERERAVVRRKGRAVRWLTQGVWSVWTVEAIEVEIVDIDTIEARVLDDLTKALITGSEYVEVTVPSGAVGLRFVDGTLERELRPGRHAAWNVLHKVHYSVIDLRERHLAVTGQDVMTKDKVTLRVNVTATVKVVDAKRLAMVARDADAAMHTAVQLVLRDAVAARTLDEILGDRDLLVNDGLDALKVRATALGLELIELGVKDLILPGEMRTLLNRVIEAQKEAEANVILRREETAATRSLAQTAKVLADNPLLVRLKELEAYKELAGKVGTVNLVLGADVMPKLELKA